MVYEVLIYWLLNLLYCQRRGPPTQSACRPHCRAEPENPEKGDLLGQHQPFHRVSQEQVRCQPGGGLSSKTHSSVDGPCNWASPITSVLLCSPVGTCPGSQSRYLPRKKDNDNNWRLHSITSFGKCFHIYYLN